MTKRENANWRSGDVLCPNCKTTGPSKALVPAPCPACAAPSCIGCRGGDGLDPDAPHLKCVAKRGAA